MNGKTKEEFLEFLEDLFGVDEKNVINYVKVEINNFGADRIIATISNMYDYVDNSFETLTKISDFLGTKKINTDNWSSGGCETCDYGSNYELQLEIHPMN